MWTLKCEFVFSCRRAAFSTTSVSKYAEDISKATTHKEAPIVDADVIVSPAKHQEKTKLSGLISVPVEVIILMANCVRESIWKFCFFFVRKIFRNLAEFPKSIFIADAFAFIFQRKMPCKAARTIWTTGKWNSIHVNDGRTHWWAGVRREWFAYARFLILKYGFRLTISAATRCPTWKLSLTAKRRQLFTAKRTDGLGTSMARRSRWRSAIRIMASISLGTNEHESPPSKFAFLLSKRRCKLKNKNVNFAALQFQR